MYSPKVLSALLVGVDLGGVFGFFSAYRHIPIRRLFLPIPPKIIFQTYSNIQFVILSYIQIDTLLMGN